MGNKYLPLINTFSNIENSYTMIVNGTRSSINNISGHNDRIESIFCRASSFNEINYIGTTISVDIKYNVGIDAIERGLIFLADTDPRSETKKWIFHRITGVNDPLFFWERKRIA